MSLSLLLNTFKRTEINICAFECILQLLSQQKYLSHKAVKVIVVLLFQTKKKKKTVETS